MWSPKQGLRSSPRGLSPGLLGCPPTWQLVPQGEQVGRERQEEASTPFKTVLEAICHILFIRSKSLSPAHTQGLWTSSKPSLTPTSFPGRFWVLLPHCSAVIPLPAAAQITASARALPCKLLEERS